MKTQRQALTRASKTRFCQTFNFEEKNLGQTATLYGSNRVFDPMNYRHPNGKHAFERDGIANIDEHSNGVAKAPTSIYATGY